MSEDTLMPAVPSSAQAAAKKAAVRKAVKKIVKTKNPHGQYFTPSNVADLMVSMLQTHKHKPILEPSAGKGVFLDSLQAAGFSSVQAVEIDSTLLTRASVPVAYQSFITWDPEYRCDAVIGNPPYIRWKNLGEDQKKELQDSPYWGEWVNSLSDYLTVFIIKSAQHLQEGGELIFITPAFWMQTQHSEPLRHFLLERGAITDLVSFGESSVFPGVASSIIIFRYVKGASSEPVKHYQYVGGRTVGDRKLDLQDEKVFQLAEIPGFQQGQAWTIASEGIQARLGLFEAWTESAHGKTFATLGSFCDIANGMVSGLDRAFKLPEEVYAKLTEKEKGALVKVTKAANLTPLYSRATTYYIDIPEGLSEARVRKDYPNLIEHLEQYREDLEKRYVMKAPLPFWQWSFKRSAQIYKDARRKVFVPCKERLTNRTHPRFALVPTGATATQDVTALAPKPGTRESAAYMAAFLSLDETAEWIRHKGLLKGGVAEFSERPLGAVPFRAVKWSEPEEVELHDAIVTVMATLEAGQLGLEEARLRTRELFKALGLPQAPA